MDWNCFRNLSILCGSALFACLTNNLGWNKALLPSTTRNENRFGIKYDNTVISSMNHNDNLNWYSTLLHMLVLRIL